MLFPLSWRSQQSGALFAHGGYRFLEAVRQALPRQLIQKGFRVEHIEVARPPLHEEKDNALRSRFMMGELGCQGIQLPSESLLQAQHAR